MADIESTHRLTLAGAQRMLEGARRKAEEMKVPQCIIIVDAGGHMLAMCRMDGAFVFSIDTAFRKAQTAALYREPTGNIADGIDLRLAIATDGKRINLPGGLPIIVDGHCVGGIGVGSGTGAEDREVGNAGLAALAGAKRF
jgi:uncharacterized protein GlcG (DUF336 family)